MGYYHYCRQCAGKVRFTKQQPDPSVICANCEDTKRLNERETVTVAKSPRRSRRRRQ